MEKVTILIPTRFDSRWIVELAIKSIRKYTEVPYKIVVGDAGVDSFTAKFLDEQKDVTVLKCPDPLRPKDFLFRNFDTPFAIVLHDDVVILRRGWLRRRLEVMKKDPRIGVLGVFGWNYIYGWKRFLSWSVLDRRFFPLGMMVRKEAQEELDLFWGKIKGFDTGGIAWLQMARQKKWKFKRYPFRNDIKHWGGLSWVMRKKLNQEKMRGLDAHLERRRLLIEKIKKILEMENF